jgi:hypothetical protein
LSIEEVVKTLVEAVHPRRDRDVRLPAELARDADPRIAVPVVLLGTFAHLLSARLLDQHADPVRLVLAIGCSSTTRSSSSRMSSG